MWSLLILMAAFCSQNLIAQDDLYYDPATDGSTAPVYDDNSDPDGNKTTKQYHDDDYYDEDEYAYEYSSRIRRFHRPVRSIDYYDPFFVDLWLYDPFYLPGATIYIGGYNDYWQWRRWNRWHRWNSWSSYDPYWSSGYTTWGWGWHRPWGWNTWNNPYVWNNYYYDPYWTWNGYNPYYCSNGVWVNNNYYWTNTGGYNHGGYSHKTYTGVRRSGTTVNPGYARIASNDNTVKPNRLTTATKDAPVIDLGNRPSSRTVPGNARDGRPGSTRPATEPGRIKNDDRSPAPNSREIEPNRPGREVTPNRETPPSREVTPNRETRPSRDVTPNRESSPSRSNNDRSNVERPSRRASEPAFDRSSRSSSSNSERSFQPSRSSNSDSGRSGNSSSSNSSSRSSDSGRSSSSSSSGGGKHGRN